VAISRWTIRSCRSVDRIIPRTSILSQQSGGDETIHRDSIRSSGASRERKETRKSRLRLVKNPLLETRRWISTRECRLIRRYFLPDPERSSYSRHSSLPARELSASPFVRLSTRLLSRRVFAHRPRSNPLRVTCDSRKERAWLMAAD